VSSAQTVRLHTLMRDKLQYGQQALEALVTSDWSTLQRDGEQLVAVTQHPDWMVLKTPEYERYSSEFVMAADRLAAAAATHDLASASAAYANLIARCVNCHCYVQLMRIASRLPE
jgi:hypothetical protein